MPGPFRASRLDPTHLVRVIVADAWMWRPEERRNSRRAME
jgi:hypothetical protein